MEIYFTFLLGGVVNSDCVKFRISKRVKEFLKGSEVRNGVDLLVREQFL
jgi:hypothetical protein